MRYFVLFLLLPLYLASSQGGAFAAVIAALVCTKSSCPGFFWSALT